MRKMKIFSHGFFLFLLLPCLHLALCRIWVSLDIRSEFSNWPFKFGRKLNYSYVNSDSFLRIGVHRKGTGWGGKLATFVSGQLRLGTRQEEPSFRF